MIQRVKPQPLPYPQYTVGLDATRYGSENEALKIAEELVAENEIAVMIKIIRNAWETQRPFLKVTQGGLIYPKWRFTR